MENGDHGKELAANHLRRVADSETLGFDTTEQLPPAGRMVGQERAAEAILFALEIDDPRYNLYISGDPGTGRQAAALAMVSQIAESRRPRHDWCYVYNFEQPSEPRSLALPAGTGYGFARDIDGFVLANRRELRRAFTDDTYTRRRGDLLRQVEAQHTALLEQLQQEALSLGFLLEGTPSGLQILPWKSLPEADRAKAGPPPGGLVPMNPDEVERLSPVERQRLASNRDLVEAEVNRLLPQIRALEEDARARLRQLDREVAETATRHLSVGILEKYAAIPPVAGYLHALSADIVAHPDVLGKPPGESDGRPDVDTDLDTLTAPAEDSAESQDRSLGTLERTDSDAEPGSGVPLDEDLRVRPDLKALLRRYKVNIFVSHSSDESAPVIAESNPTYSNLTGRIEFGVRNGLPYTDHLMVRPGALHRANGGFIILQAADVLSQPRSWDTVKRMLRFGAISSESISDADGLPPSASLRPQPIPAEVKVVLIGDSETYTLLMSRDAEFPHLFKVRADFDREMPRNQLTEHFYGCFAGDVARRTGGPPLTTSAVALLIEEGSRRVEDQDRLSTQLGHLSDLTVEACHFAKKLQSTLTERAHVAKAIETREQRLGLLKDKLDQMIYRGTTLIDTSSVVIGQVNGLSLVHEGDYSFGRPVRITARTSPGWSGVMDLEREIGAGGPSHSKGVLILSGYLAGRYAQQYPMSLAASLCFEQLYDEVDGDSASSAELYALLSSLSGVGIKQSLAVTGSVNQRGEIQAVGGVTYKIESFFRICRQRGLDNNQGVIIPQANIHNLMLQEEVVKAVRTGQFHIYAISTVDEGIELLTGIPAGKPDPNGRHLEGTINARITRTLRAYSERVQSYLFPLPTSGRRDQ